MTRPKGRRAAGPQAAAAPPTGATLLTADADRRRAAMVFYPVRRAVHRMTADCERMLESLHHADRKAWRDLVGDALVASRQLLSIVTHSIGPGDTSELTRRISTLATRLREPKQRVVDALAALLEFSPASLEEELLLEDARNIRDTAANLLGVLETPVSSGAHGTVTPVLAASADHGPARILVVDDQLEIRSVLRRHVEKLNCEVFEAENGRIGLERARSMRFDLVLTDINMPEMDGMALLKALKADEATRDIPVIVISSLGDEDSVVECIRQGAEDYVPKPFRPLVLSARVRATLDRKRMRDDEKEYLRRVHTLTSAAEAVDRGQYAAGALAGESTQADALGRLARVFDRMVGGFRSREQRLKRRLGQLRQEVGETRTREIGTGAPDDASPFHTGEILAARYEILGTLGRGGMGTVYRARDLELKDDVAVKVVRRDLVEQDPTVVQRLKSEIRLARKISHRNVVRLHDIGEWKGVHFISMEHVAGITVAELLDRKGRLSVESVVAIGTQLADALAVAHEAQVIHRDIKPSNLIVDEAGVLKVMDFGIARSVEREDAITLGGFIVGTPEYMAPEQLMGGNVDVRSDLFAVGVVLYECLTGRPPFVADSPTALLAQMVDGKIPHLSEFVGGVPAALESMILQQLQFQAKDRIGSARELADRLSETELPTRQADTNPLLQTIDIEIVPLDR